MREHQFFTSDLSVNEFLLVKEAGFQPLGLVMGSSIYSIGAQQLAGSDQGILGAREMLEEVEHQDQIERSRGAERAVEVADEDALAPASAIP